MLAADLQATTIHKRLQHRPLVLYPRQAWKQTQLSLFGIVSVTRLSGELNSLRPTHSESSNSLQTVLGNCLLSYLASLVYGCRARP